jgi:hypothetical protein
MHSEARRHIGAWKINAGRCTCTLRQRKIARNETRHADPAPSGCCECTAYDASQTTACGNQAVD